MFEEANTGGIQGYPLQGEYSTSMDIVFEPSGELITFNCEQLSLISFYLFIFLGTN